VPVVWRTIGLSAGHRWLDGMAAAMLADQAMMMTMAQAASKHLRSPKSLCPQPLTALVGGDDPQTSCFERRIDVSEAFGTGLAAEAARDLAVEFHGPRRPRLLARPPTFPAAASRRA
jgi:hypothetical protein